MDHDAPRPPDVDIAEAVALGWERHREFLEGAMTPVREWVISGLAAGAGDTILELAAGAGDTGYDAVTRVGDGRLITSDASPTMLDIARRRAREIGISGGEYRLVDAADIDLPADSVERVICRFGYMFVPDPGSALAETRRVLRPGGRLALAVWAGPEHNPYFTLLMATLAELGHAPPVDPAAAGPLSLGDADRLAGLLAGAGFTDVVIEPVPVAFGFDDIVEYVALSEEVAGPIMAILPGLTPDQRAEVIAKVEAAAAPFRAGPGYEFPGVALCAQAVSP